MLSKKAKYALKGMISLAEKYGDGPILVSDLAAANLPRKFLELILLELKNHGLVQSKKGKGGGYFLAKAPKSITIGQIVRIVDGPIAPIQCVSRSAYIKCDECPDERICGIRLVMKDVRDAMSQIMDSTTLADVLGRVQSVEAGKQGLNFTI